jgi:L-ascorbate metabolism protein UlaG (beta-lactamase superfamily)
MLAPGPRAMNLAGRYLPLLRSFVASPSVHLAASRDPSLLGGNFVDLSERDIRAVESLIRDTSSKCARLLEFARDYKSLVAALQERAKGFSLVELERELPESLAGAVELVYDLATHPRVRLIEELLYESNAMNPAVEEICIHDPPDNQRPFFSNTPLLDRSDRLFLQIPFRDSRIDRIARARIEPQSMRTLAAELTGDSDGLASVQRFFCPSPPSRAATEYGGKGVRVRYFGHACVFLQTARVAVLIDPTTAWSRDDEEATLTFSDLPDRIDYLVLSHAHEDHLVPELLLQLRYRVGTVVVPANASGNLADPSMRQILRHLGFTSIIVAEPFDKIELHDGSLMSAPFFGEQGGLDIASKQCAVVSLAGKAFLFLVDSAASHPASNRRVAERIGKIDVVFIGMECHGAPLSWLYGPLLGRAPSKKDDESRRISASNSIQAWAAAEAFNCSHAFVYAMGQEPWVRHLLGLAYTEDSVQIRESNLFLERCTAAGIKAERLKGCRELFF